MRIAKEVSSRKDFLIECRKAVHSMHSRFPHILCEGDVAQDEGREEPPMSKVERAWCDFLWQLDEEIRAEGKR